MKTHLDRVMLDRTTRHDHTGISYPFRADDVFPTDAQSREADYDSERRIQVRSEMTFDVTAKFFHNLSHMIYSSV